MDKYIVVYVYNGILFKHKKKNEILLLGTTWMDLEDMINEISQRKTNTI